METVFDHNITRKELEAVFGFATTTLEDLVEWTQIDHYSLIYRLYIYRKQKDIAKLYSDKIPNSIHKVFGTCNHDFAI